MRPVAFAFLPLCLAFSLPAAAEDNVCERKVSIVGRAHASHVPDYMALILASESKAANAAGALEASARAVAEIGALARDLGVPAGDIRTVSIMLEEATRTVTRTLGADQREPDGYRVSNRVSVRLADRSRAGELVRRALDKSGIRIESVKFGLDDPGKAEIDLIVAAGKDARARATALAEAAGTSVGIVCSLKAGGVQQMSPMPQPTSQPYKQKEVFSSSSEGADGKPGLRVPLESGTVDLFIEVTAEFAARP